MINLMIDIEISTSLPQNILTLVVPIKKKLEDLINKILIANESYEITIIEKTLLKVLLRIEDPDFFLIMNANNLKEKMLKKTTTFLASFKEIKAFDKKKEIKLIFSLVLLGKICTISEETPENLTEISNLAMRIDLWIQKILINSIFLR